MDQAGVKYSMKNLPVPTKHESKIFLTEEVEKKKKNKGYDVKFIPLLIVKHQKTRNGCKIEKCGETDGL